MNSLALYCSGMKGHRHRPPPRSGRSSFTARVSRNCRRPSSPTARFIRRISPTIPARTKCMPYGRSTPRKAARSITPVGNPPCPLPPRASHPAQRLRLAPPSPPAPPSPARSSQPQPLSLQPLPIRQRIHQHRAKHRSFANYGSPTWRSRSQGPSRGRPLCRPASGPPLIASSFSD